MKPNHSLSISKNYCPAHSGMMVRLIFFITDFFNRHKSNHFSLPVAFSVLMLLTAAFSAGLPSLQNRVVRVGVYQNEPKIFINDEGKASGFFIELIEKIAAQEGWTLVYVQCEWNICLQNLQNGTIDLMPDVAYSAERAVIFDFHKVPVIESWSRVYAAHNITIDKLSNLNGKRVAVLKGSIQQTVFQQLMDGFGYKVTLIPVDSFNQAFNAAGNGLADAAITNQLFGDYFYQKYGLAKTTIDFEPVELYYATAHGRSADLLEAIDRDLGKWIPEQNSPYYTTLGNWSPKETYQVPDYVWWVLFGIVFLLLIAGGIIFLLRQKISRRNRRLEQASMELQKSEQDFQTLARISPVGIFRTDANGGTTYVNPKWCAISGLSVDQALGDGWLDAVHPDDRGKLSSNWQEAAKLRQASYSDYRFLRSDGTIAWVMGQALPEIGTDDQISGYVGTITDITDRKQVEAALQASAHQLALIYANISDIVFYLVVEPDGQFRFASVNSSFLKVTGLKEDQVIGKLVQEIIPEPSLNLVLENYKKVIQTKELVAWEEISIYPTGKKYGEVSAIPVLDADGTCAFILGTVHDITDRKQAEDAIKNLNAELELRVQERTAQLRAVNKELESFSYSVSHDLRAPLRAISGFSSIIARRHRSNLNEEGQHYIDNIVQASDRMGHLIDDLLTYARIGRSGIRREPVSYTALMSDLTRTMQPLVEKTHGSLQIDPGLSVIVGDYTLFSQIFTNLLENAFTYHKPELPPLVSIKNSCTDKKIIIEVSDNGIGIPLEHQEKVFNIFQRLHSDDEYPGTGIGLATVKKSVELLGGSVCVRSILGEGSTFVVSLPKD